MEKNDTVTIIYETISRAEVARLRAVEKAAKVYIRCHEEDEWATEYQNSYAALKAEVEKSNG